MDCGFHSIHYLFMGYKLTDKLEYLQNKTKDNHLYSKLILIVSKTNDADERMDIS